MSEYYYHERNATNKVPQGLTVSKQKELPTGDFQINEYNFECGLVLWFVDMDTFTANERYYAYLT